MLQVQASIAVVVAATLASCTETPEPRSPRFPSGVRGIFEDSRGHLWLSSPDGLSKFDPSNRDAADGGFTNLGNSLPGIMISGFREDADGRMYVQNANGIHRYEDGELKLLPRDYDSRHDWSTRDGDLWFALDGAVETGTEEGEWGVYRVRDGACTFLAFPEPPPGERQNFYALTSRAMHAPDGTLWFGTFNAAFGYDGESWDIVGRARMGRADDSRHIGIRGYHLDSRGLLWMADNGAGVYVYDGEQVVHFTALHGLRDEDTDGNSLHRSFSIGEDADGNIWIGTVYSGIWRYEPSKEDPVRKGTFTNFDDAQGYVSRNVWAIHRTRSGELLFAAEEPGWVYRFDGTAFERAF